MIELRWQTDLSRIAVNKVIQVQGSVVICAVVEGGLEESDDDDDDGQYQTKAYKSRT